MGEKDMAAALQAVLAEVDQVPATAMQAARAALGWRTLDADLARLTAESALEPSHLRGGQPRLLTYRNQDTVIELEVSSADGVARLLGQLDPPRAAGVTVESVTGPQTTQADSHGRFSFTGLRAGWMRVIVTQADGGTASGSADGAASASADGATSGSGGAAERITTEWFRA